MERLQLNVPDMYGDHHVLRARTVLVGLDGVEDVVASASFRSISLSYDPARVTMDAIHATLAGAGYPVAPAQAATIPMVPVGSRRGDPAWERLGIRVAATDARDAKANR